MASEESSKGSPGRDVLEDLSREEIESITQQYRASKAEMKNRHPDWTDEEIERYMVNAVLGYREGTFREQQDIFRDYYPGISDDEIRQRIARGERFKIPPYRSRALALADEEFQALVSWMEKRLQDEEESVTEIVDVPQRATEEPVHARPAMRTTDKPMLLNRLWSFVRRSWPIKGT